MVKKVFVFASNLAGNHGNGSALEAKENWGAMQGIGIGPTGNAYAIPTKDERLSVLPLTRIKVYVDRFLRYAEAHHELDFEVVAIGCGNSGYKAHEIAPFFLRSTNNVHLPHEFVQAIARRRFSVA